MSQQNGEPTIGRIVSDIIGDLNVIISHQVSLVKRELGSSAKVAGIGAAMFLVAGFLGLLVLIFLSITLAQLISMTGLHPAWCYLIVAGLYLLIAIILVLVGVHMIKKIKVPEETIWTAKQLPAALKGEAPLPVNGQPNAIDSVRATAGSAAASASKR